MVTRDSHVPCGEEEKGSRDGGHEERDKRQVDAEHAQGQEHGASTRGM